MTDDPTPIEHPTYMADIRHFFRDIDIDHMKDPQISGGGIELGTYVGVKANALRIYVRTKEGTMPPDQAWPEWKVETFYNWIRDNFPRGQSTPVPAMLAAAPTALRVRRNLASLTGPELDKVKAAFRGIMARDASDPNSYFQVAGIHWLPGGGTSIYYCRHHENAYNPWHRAYLMRFEDALRTVPGCEDVTLPYWDITEPEIPSVLFDEPFASYTIPRELTPMVGPSYPAGTVTRRNDAKAILATFNDPKVALVQNVKAALGFSRWEEFNGWDAGRTQTGIIRAHDNGHNACGPTMQNQDVAAFDPIFWFFHSNWDRLWWKWQQQYGATTLNTFKGHLAGDAGWLEDRVVNGLPPFTMTAAETIDLSAMDVDYEHPADEPVLPHASLRGSFLAAARFSVAPTPKVSVRLKEVDRLEIPGSFNVYLKVGGRVVAQDGLFQPTTPKLCATCRKSALVSFDFLVDQDELSGGEIEAEIRLLTRDGGEMPFSLARAGNPTINARLLLQ
ncbi:MAG TPA: tyrosinase family protein [Allosphingosinicella sp.]